MNSTLSILLFLALAAQCRAAIISDKVFNYHGTNMPIKDDRTGQVFQEHSNETDLLEPTAPKNQAESEAACWNLIVEQSAVTFALQNRVLDELEKDLTNLGQLNSATGERVKRIADKMRANMKDALEALNAGSAEEYFDNLFDSSDNIIEMATLIRDPKLDETLFMVLVKAVSRLGRNNSALVQEFTDRCSLVERGPRPRVASV